MNLIIDIGNSNIKMAVFKSSVMLKKQTTDADDLQKNITRLLSKYPEINNAILANSGRIESQIVSKLKKKMSVLQLTPTTSVPYTNAYATPKTLGLDRIGLIAASVKQYPSSNVMVIDAGTCITYDFIDINDMYHGGAISPGLLMRYKAMNKFTARLPLLKPKETVDLVGNSTENAMHSGVIFGITAEIDGIIEQYKADYPNLTVILTGGDSEFLSKRIKNSIFANSNFLLEGLNHILEFNTHA